MSREPYDPMMIGRNICAMRRGRGYTQQEHAKQAGCSTGTVSALERGRRDMSVNMLFALCRALQCRPADLLAGQ